MPDFTVEGMSCQHCVKAVTRAVQEVDPQAQVLIDLPSGKVSIDSSQPAAALSAAIDEAGYAVQPG